VPGMTEQEVIEFLEEPGHLVRLATVDPEDGWPHVVPIWYLYRDGRIYITPRERSAWRFHLLADNRVGMDIDDGRRKVIIKGRVEEVHPNGENAAWRDLWWLMALRGMPVEAAIAYSLDTADEPRSLWALDLSRAEEVRTWRPADPARGDDPGGWWAKRYFTRR